MPFSQQYDHCVFSLVFYHLSTHINTYFCFLLSSLETVTINVHQLSCVSSITFKCINTQYRFANIYIMGRSEGPHWSG